MPTFKVAIAYDGTDYVGWQRQATGVSVQALVEEALQELDQRMVNVIGAGRTDAGVHAAGQIASFSIDRAIEPDALVRAINARLPPDVRVLTAQEAPAGFHARFHARSKTYRYRIWNAAVLSPFERRYAWHLTGLLDVGAMSRAARLLEGRHDFAAFQAEGGDTRSTVREITLSRVVSSGTSGAPMSDIGAPDAVAGPLVVYQITGTGFLRYMVRNIAGTLAEVGRGRRTTEWVGEVLASRDRAKAGPTAPAGGLVLVAVDYEENGASLATDS